MTFILIPGALTLANLRAIWMAHVSITLDAAAYDAIHASCATVQAIVAKGDPAYGINTGFGILAKAHIPQDQLEKLQRNLIVSHAVGTGALLPDPVVRLIDAHLSGLPSFLVREPGLNSGFMIAHVTAAALASENKSMAHPASVDSLPTSANQEDHVSMATFAARRLDEMAHNTAVIVGIELLAAAQGIEFHRPLRSSAILEQVHAALRTRVAPFDEDRFFAPDIEAARQMVVKGELSAACKELFAVLHP